MLRVLYVTVDNCFCVRTSQVANCTNRPSTDYCKMKVTKQNRYLCAILIYSFLNQKAISLLLADDVLVHTCTGISYYHFQFANDDVRGT